MDAATLTLALCIALAGGDPVRLPVDRFDLSWIHSVEKVEWREHWVVEQGGLRLHTARIKGSGAGMEPPEGARWEEGWWVYHPRLPVQTVLRLAASGYTDGHVLCAGGECRGLESWLHQPAGDLRPVELRACPS